MHASRMLTALVLWAGAAGAAAQAPVTGATFRDCADCPEMVVVSGGNFRMGSQRERVLGDSELPRHQVTIGYAFAVGRLEITRGQFAAFVRDSGYAGHIGKGCLVLRHADLQWTHDDAKSWEEPGYEQGDDHPVVCVSWEDVTAYVDWISRKTGKKFRLLSESEWEYVALGGSRATRPWGDDEKDACRHANVWDETYGKEKGLPRERDQATRPVMSKGGVGFGGQSFNSRTMNSVLWYRNNHWCSDSYAVTSPVGKLEPNGFGLHDVIGNAWEWVEDCLNPNYAGAPVDGSAWKSGNCGLRVLRGGSWASIATDARAARRQFREISFRRADLGFRIARAP